MKSIPGLYYNPQFVFDTAVKYSFSFCRSLLAYLGNTVDTFVSYLMVYVLYLEILIKENKNELVLRAQKVCESLIVLIAKDS